jgi:hypothetical protein
MWDIFALLDPDPQNQLNTEPKKLVMKFFREGELRPFFSTLNSTFQTF